MTTIKNNKTMNILEILKNKPFGTQLWSPAFGDVRLNDIDEDDMYPIRVKYKNPVLNEQNVEYLTADGKIEDFPNGECILYPSKQMRNWDKFTWKKGDVLHVGGEKFIIFERYDDNGTYSRVCGKYRYDKSDNEVIRDVIVHTSKCEAADAISASLVRASIEMHYDGKLNPETLEIVKDVEFNDGDIVYIETDTYKIVCIFKKFISEKKPAAYADFFLHCKSADIPDEYAGYNIICDWEEIEEIRLATDEEKELLFSKLAGIGKEWNPDTKQLEPLSKKHELKPFDKVLVRSCDECGWMIEFFGHMNEVGDEAPYECMTSSWSQCIPYEGNEHLLGTTDSPE